MLKWIAIAAVVLWAWYEGDGNPFEGAQILLNEITRGKRVTKAPYSKKDGVVHADPSKLADQAHVDLDTYALARMVSSEEGNSDNTIRVAVLWAVVNYAQREGIGIPKLLLRANNGNHSGFFGTQRDIDPTSDRYNKSDRYASTALDPYEGDLELAISVLLGTIPDPTGGATNFDRPAGEADPVRVANNRIGSGMVPAPVAGIDSNKIRFWKWA